MFVCIDSQGRLLPSSFRTDNKFYLTGSTISLLFAKRLTRMGPYIDVVTSVLFVVKSTHDNENWYMLIQ